MGLYYRIWVDCISKIRSNEINKSNWQLKSMVAMSIAMTFNFAFIMIIIQKQVFDNFFYEINLPILSGHENYILTMLILYILPCIIVNYFLIFYNKRYEKLLNKYSFAKGKLFLAYFLISLFFPILIMWIGIIYSRL